MINNACTLLLLGASSNSNDSEGYTTVQNSESQENYKEGSVKWSEVLIKCFIILGFASLILIGLLIRIATADFVQHFKNNLIPNEAMNQPTLLSTWQWNVTRII